MTIRYLANIIGGIIFIVLCIALGAAVMLFIKVLAILIVIVFILWFIWSAFTYKPEE